MKTAKYGKTKFVIMIQFQQKQPLLLPAVV